MKIALRTGGWLIVVAWAILVACLPGGGSGTKQTNETSGKVTSPASGDIWRLGETRVIRWEPGESSGVADLWLFRGSKGRLIAGVVPLIQKEYTWKVGVLEDGSTVSPDSDYEIFLTNL